jgi:hypothetical protein
VTALTSPRGASPTDSGYAAREVTWLGKHSRSITMSVLSRTVGRAGVIALAVAMLSLLPGKANAQFNPFNPLNPFNPFNPVVPFPVPVNPNAIGNQGGGVTRATSSLANPINFYQYGQITGVGPITGTVRIYNQFGLLGMNNNQNGLNGLFGGLGGLNNNNQLPGQGATQGDDPPQGVLLHVNTPTCSCPISSRSMAA